MKPILAILVCLPFIAASPVFQWSQGPYVFRWQHVSTEWQGEWTPAEKRVVAETLNRVLRAPVYVGNQPGKPPANLIIARPNQDLAGCAKLVQGGKSRMTIAKRVIGTGAIKEIATHEANHLKGWWH